MSKKAGRAWKGYFEAKGEGRVLPSLASIAARLSAERDAIAYKTLNHSLFKLEEGIHSINGVRIQEQANAHSKRLSDIKSLSTSQQTLAHQLEQSYSSMNTHQARAWQKAWAETAHHIQNARNTPANCAVLHECSFELNLSDNAKTVLSTLSEYSITPEDGHKKTSSKARDVSSAHFDSQLQKRGKSELASPKIDAATVNDMLMANPESTYRAIFGEPKSTTSSVMNYPGGLKVTIKGSKSGLWNHFAEMKGGAPIQAIMYARQVDFKEALRIGAELAGSHDYFYLTSVKPIERQRNQEASDVLKQRSAQSIWNGAKPIANSLAEIYLKKHRGISDHSNLQDVRFWPVGSKWDKLNEAGELVREVNKIPVWVIAARNSQMEITAVQRVYLDNNTGNKNQFMKAAKLSCGVIKGSAGVIQKGAPNGRVYIAEGPETAASIAIADPKASVLVSFSVSNMHNLAELVKRFKPSEVIIAADNDGQAAHTKNTTEKAAEVLNKAQLNTRVIYPDALNGRDKTDWNDVLKHQGIAAVKEQLQMNKQDINSNHRHIQFESHIIKNPSISQENKSLQKQHVKEMEM